MLFSANYYIIIIYESLLLLFKLKNFILFLIILFPIFIYDNFSIILLLFDVANTFFFLVLTKVSTAINSD